MSLSCCRVVGSHGLGNQLFQLAFAHFLRKFSKEKIIFENNPLISKGIKFMLDDMDGICDHINYRKNLSISHENLVGRGVMKLRKTELISNIIMANYFMKKIIVTDSKKIFDFQKQFGQNDIYRTQYFGFFLNWRYVHSEKNTLLPEVLKLVESNCNIFLLPKSNRKRLVIHVRRGDFLVRGNDEILGVINPASYKELIKIVINLEKGLDIYTLTDDLELSKNPAYGPLFGKILHKNDINEWQALQLMIDADYIIAANSTFSWWGAVLSHYKKDSKCFIPKTYFKNLDDKGAFLYPGLKTYQNSHL